MVSEARILPVSWLAEIPPRLRTHNFNPYSFNVDYIDGVLAVPDYLSSTFEAQVRISQMLDREELHADADSDALPAQDYHDYCDEGGNEV